MKGRKAFTLVEVLIAAGLMAFLAVVLARLWQGAGRATVDLIVAGRLNQEANLAVAALQRDLGGCLPGPGGRPGTKGAHQFVGRLQPSGSELWLCFDGGASPNGVADWASPDAVIIYRVAAGQLLRVDQTAGTSFTVARHVDSLSVVDLGGSTRITLTFSYRGTTRAYTLTARDP